MYIIISYLFFLYRLTCWTPSMTTLNSKSIFIFICISLPVSEVQTHWHFRLSAPSTAPNPFLLLATHLTRVKRAWKNHLFLCWSIFFRAMSSPTNKEQFLKQFDSIVRGIVDNKERVGKPSTCSRALATGFCFPALATRYVLLLVMFSRACHSLCFLALITLGSNFLLRVLIG